MNNGVIMSLPKVSVLIPSYNHEKYVKEAIESVLNQTFQDFELIITDDGSTDGTVDKIKEFDDERIQLYVFDENQGACNAMNNCIKHAKGKYIAYISSDDVWETYKLEKQINFIEKNPDIEVVFSKASFIGENSELLDENSSSTEIYNLYKNIFDKKNRSKEEWLRRFFFSGNCICHPSILIRKRVYDDVGLYDERLASVPDFDMWIRVCLKYEIHIMDEKLIRFRIRDNNENISSPTQENNQRIRFEQKQILNHYLEISNVSMFLKIFPKSEKYGKVTKELIPYFLGRLAHERNIDFYKLWGLETIYNLMESDEVSLLEENGFKFRDFIKMTASTDIFHMYEIMALKSKLESQRGKIKKQEDLLENKNKKCNEMESSVSWKITKPVRKIGSFLRKIL